MEITASELDWTFVDSQRLAEFLNTETGKRFIPKIVENAPPLLAEGDSNKILIRSGELRGLQEVVKTILILAHPPVEKTAPEAVGYPAPEDDSRWADGQKMLPPEKSQTPIE
jgi:hypothetical protein